MDIRAHVVALNEQRINVIEQIRGELVATAGRERTAEETVKIERMEADVARLKAEIDEFVAVETRNAEAVALREAQSFLYGEAAPAKQMSPNEELRALLSGRGGTVDPVTGQRYMEIDIRGAAREMAVIRNGGGVNELRALAWDTGSSASLVPTTLARSLYQYLEAGIAAFRMGTTKINTTSGEPLLFPRLGAHSIATQVSGQGTTLAGTDPTFARMQLDAFKYGELVRVSSEMLADSGIDLGAFLGADIGRALSRKIDVDLIVGSGSGAPNGIMTAVSGSGTIATGGSLITPTVEKLIDLKYSVNDQYRSDPSCAWLMNDSTAGTLAKLRDGAGGTVGAFLWRPSLTAGLMQGAPDMFLDKPVFVDPNVAAQGSNAKTVAFGAMSAYYVRTVGNPIIETDNSRFFDTDEVAYRGKFRVDGDLIDTTAINVIKQNV
jgi:HK97 family phage major capsid protein